MFRKHATPYYPCFACVHRHEGAGVSKILANFVTVKLLKLLHLYASWLSEVLAFRDILHAVLNSAGFFFHVEVELQ